MNFRPFSDTDPSAASNATNVAAIRVAWLSGEKQLTMTASSIESFRACCRERVEAWVLSDGSLSEAAGRKVLGRDVRFVVPDDLVTRRDRILRDRPALAWHYRVSPLAKKIVDVPQMFDAPFFFCDSDILFFKSFSLSSVVEAQWRFVYMLDYMNGYSLHWRHRRRQRRQVPLVEKCNTGLLFVRAENWIDYDHVDSIAANPVCRWHLAHLEQTQWASLAAQDISGSGFWSPRQVAFPNRSTVSNAANYKSCAIALHYAGPLRDLMPDLASPPVTSGEPPPELLIEPAQRHRVTTDLAAGVQRVIARVGKQGRGL